MFLSYVCWVVYCVAFSMSACVQIVLYVWINLFDSFPSTGLSALIESWVVSIMPDLESLPWKILIQWFVEDIFGFLACKLNKKKFIYKMNFLSFAKFYFSTFLNYYNTTNKTYLFSRLGLFFHSASLLASKLSQTNTKMNLQLLSIPIFRLGWGLLKDLFWSVSPYIGGKPYLHPNGGLLLGRNSATERKDLIAKFLNYQWRKILKKKKKWFLILVNLV